jgi:hypothetical protein
MSFSGNLEHLPIVDVIQLLETSKKTGTLMVQNNSLKYQFGFNNGHICSVTHPDTTQSLLKFLSLNKVFQEEKIKQIEQDFNKSDKTLIRYLYEKKLLKNATLKSLLTNFVEITVVDILTWKEGSFNFSPENVEISNEFSDFNSLTGGQLLISTQNTLMEALRIFDEWRRDGLLKENLFGHDIKHITQTNEQQIEITEDILGLDNIEKLERKIPDVFTGIKEIDYTQLHRNKLSEVYPEIDTHRMEDTINFLAKLDAQKFAQKADFTFIYYGNDLFLQHVIETMGKNLGAFVFITDSIENLDVIINQSKIKNLTPILIIDGKKDEPEITDFENIKIIRLLPYKDVEKFYELLDKETFAIFLKPDKEDIDKLLAFYKSFYNYFKRLKFNDNFYLRYLTIQNKLLTTNHISKITSILTEYLSEIFSKVLFFMIQQDTLTLEKSIAEQKEISIKIPLKEVPSLFEIIKSSPLYYGSLKKEIWDILLKYFPSLKNEKITLISLYGVGKPIAVIYCADEKRTIDFSLLEHLQKSLSAHIQNLLYRKMFEKYRKTE